MFSTRRLEQCRTITLTKRICRRKASAFRKARQSKKSRDWERYSILKLTTLKTCREAYNNYLIKTLISDPNDNNRLGALIKSKQHDHLGVAPHRKGNIIYCDPIQKANILNRQFISVFTDDTKTSIPHLGPSQYPSMEDITVSCKGVVKQLMIIRTTHCLVHAAHEALRQFSVSMSIYRLLIPVVCWYQGCLDQPIAVMCS